MIPAWAVRYVGAPFKNNGASLDGLNCWGLCHLVLKEQAGVITPVYAEASAREHFEIVDDIWMRVDEPRQFDCLLMSAMSESDRPSRIPAHVGIMLDNRYVLHVWSQTDAVVMPISHPMIRSKIIATYRHRDMQ